MVRLRPDATNGCLQTNEIPQLQRPVEQSRAANGWPSKLEAQQVRRLGGKSMVC